MRTPRPPAHIRALADCGKTYQELCNFRRQLESFRITACYHEAKRAWILGKIPRTGPHFIKLEVNTEALAELMADPMAVARNFERIEKESQPCT